MWLLGRFLAKIITSGTLGVVDANGRFYRFGCATPTGRPDVIVRLHDKNLHWKLAVHPDLYLGEAYMDGTLEITGGNVWDLLELCGRNLAAYRQERYGAFMRVLVRLAQYATQFNSRSRARKNVAHHYDLSRALYSTFLGLDMQYSCAYFPTSKLTIDQAQDAKKTHIAAKLLLKPNQRVLDIGCGWGGLAIDLARNYGVRVDGITLSHEQLIYAEDYAKEEEQSEQVKFFLKDYRDLDGGYDRVVSIGMFEHVGVPSYSTFFGKLAELLAPNGVALIHTIGTTYGPNLGNPWIRKYIFPGGYIPALSEIMPAIERAGLVVTDVEVLRLHYAETLRLWREQFLANWTSLCSTYDDRFRRMWEFYLAGSEMGFRYGGLVVFQIQVAKDQAAVPLTRDYIYEFERAANDQQEMKCQSAQNSGGAHG